MDDLQKLCDIDLLISDELTKTEINALEIVRLVDNREQLLQSLLSQLENTPALKQHKEWPEVISRTQKLVELMQNETSVLGRELKKFRHNQRSLQQYRKFT